MPLAIDLKVADLTFPLAQFHAREMSKDGILDVLKSLNARCSKPLDDDRLTKACDLWWPELESKLAELEAEAPVSSSATPARSDRDLLEEILITVRGFQAPVGESPDVAQRDALADLMEILARYAQTQYEDEDATGILKFALTEDANGRYVHIKVPRPLPSGVTAQLWRLAATAGLYIDFEIDGV